MNLDDLLNEMSEKMRNRDLSDEYLREHNNSTRDEIGIGEYAYGITMIPCEWVYEYLSDYKRVLKENEELLEVKVSASANNRILELEKENEELNKENEHLHREINRRIKLKIENEKIVDTQFISIQKIKDKIEELYQQDRNWSEEMSEPDSNFKNIDRNLKRIKNQIDVLKELIENND